ncbi:M23 family metallopeptidase [Xylanimonas allomyrinae]|uniref:M23 family metallopeptidase n=1 Tax=Xylanimonas allomyrinae TaxID=2509459 RepID=A0A4P6EPW8_9MICO|nr:M23 family metallopeptidase [Xylanimonas allomyrinae]
MVAVLGVAGLAAHAFADDCASGPTRVGTIPDGFIGHQADGTAVRLTRSQLGHAATIIDVGSRIPNVEHEGVIVALTAALTESRLHNLANPSAYPESTRFANDGIGSDHDSLGLFQMRPVAGWGTVAQLMDPTYQAEAFYGGTGGPNHGSPRGLLDIPGWSELEPGAAAQAVEVSAHPDRYTAWVPVAEQVVAALTHAAPLVEPVETTSPDAGSPGMASAGSATATVVFPLPQSTWTRTSGYGTRTNPVLHVVRLHAGVDLAAVAGTPVLATADGRVVVAEHSGGLGNHVAVEHTIDGTRVVSVYGHLLADSAAVTVGADVVAGQVIGHVGSTGNSTGPHLHFEIRPGGVDQPAIDPTAWLNAAMAGGQIDLGDVIDRPPACTKGATGP